MAVLHYVKLAMLHWLHHGGLVTGCVIVTVLHWLCYSGYATLAILQRLSYSYFTAETVLQWLCYIGYTTVAVLQLLHCSDCVTVAVLRCRQWLCYSYFTTVTVLQWLCYIGYTTVAVLQLLHHNDCVTVAMLQCHQWLCYTYSDHVTVVVKGALRLDLWMWFSAAWNGFSGIADRVFICLYMSESVRDCSAWWWRQFDVRYITQVWRTKSRTESVERWWNERVACSMCTRVRDHG